MGLLLGMARAAATFLAGSLAKIARVLCGLARRVVTFSIIASAPVAAHGAGLASSAPVSGIRWGEAGKFDLKETLRTRSLARTMRGRSAPAAATHTNSNWSAGAGNVVERVGAAHMTFNLETLPVTIGGQRFVLSHFTVTPTRVRGTVSAAF
jgi:hypothetical protein